MHWLGEDIAGSGPGTQGRHATEAIEGDLYRHRQELFGEGASFDTTSLYFEGAGRCEDDRPHRKQIILGMVLGGGDRPFASLLRSGNTADVTRSVVERLRTRFGINEICAVADPGVISAATIAAPHVNASRSRLATPCSRMMASPCRYSFPVRKVQLSSPSRTSWGRGLSGLRAMPQRGRTQGRQDPRRNHRQSRAQARARRQGAARQQGLPALASNPRR